MYQRAIHSIEIDLVAGTNSQWVQLLPLGNFSGSDGRGPYQINDPKTVIEMTAAHSVGRDLPVDYDHQTEFANKNGKPAPAAGWIKEFDAREDGIYGRIEWTEKAAAAIQAKEFRYISPVFFHTKDGRIGRIDSAGLTNKPNLQMKALSSQQQTLGNDMNLNKLLIKLFGLADDATPEQISAHAQGLVEGDDQAKAAMSTLTTALGLGAEATTDDLVKAVQSVQEKSGSNTPDPDKFVPMAAFKELQTEVKSLQSQSQTNAADSAVEKALADKKITPAMEDWAKSYHKRDPKGFEDYISTAPVLSLNAAHVEAGDPKGDGKGLSADEKAVCAQLGMSEETFIKERGDQE
ncbi:phage protease [Paremcibacter congregatus]|uniref:phage protease n=1 Tax=Paremcibacter congregatus TaxID=2043170 RepID=UPI0030EB2DC2|tara:strand:+ start:5418 stop:6464 length:1047 start_codon:yes stop_codon:yes gene_type:complete